MTGPARIAAFAAAVALLSGGAAVAGGAIDPKGQADGEHSTASAPGHGDEAMTTQTSDNPSGGHSAESTATAAGDQIRGLAVADEGLRLVVDTPEIERGREQRLTYRIVDQGGDPVRDFEVEHEKRMHLILVRRDATGFQHLHPRQERDGSWSAPVRIDDAGSYRAFADFTRDGEAQTLAADIRVDGEADLRELPEPSTVARTSDGYEVRIDTEGDELAFDVTRDGRAVQVEPYLGADGHLVALREGDLAFLHVHPVEGEEDDDAIRFGTEFPTEGRYRLFLQFRHEGRVHTAEFTKEVR